MEALILREEAHCMETRDAVVEIISQTLHVAPAELADDRKLVDLAEDSIALFELLIRFEQALGGHIKYEDIAHIETVGDVIAYANTLPADLLKSAFNRTQNPPL